MVVADGLHGDAVADDIFASDGDLQAFFQQAELEVPAGGGGGGRGAVEEELEWLLNEDAFPAVETMEPKQAVMGRRTAAAEPGQRRCQHCGTTETPQWRQGPEGRGTLCNACGVRYRTGRLLPEYRPVNSPTFSPQVHSNRHHRVVEMHHRRGSSARDTNAVGSFTLPTCQFPRGSRSRRGVVNKKRSRIHPDSRGSWYGNGGKVWFLQGLEVTAGAGGEEAAAEEELDWLSMKDALPAKETTERKPPVVGPQTMAAVYRRRRALASSPSPTWPSAGGVPLPGQRRCRHCSTTETPQWREGPEGRGTLCNACGVSYGKGHLVPQYRPLSSPTFSPELHSNIHRRVLQMQLPVPGNIYSITQ
ncbi:uncharacterized protein [Lolium perenne]|uniref:uncharacterized protein n=1 Tax=Lolium perenne TaxID=4522 RepID=UPI003A99137B